jgi:glycosyltransferase involved in cell wall biosynthesis
MKISYAITVCNEINEFKTLFEFLIKNKNERDEIVILVDETNSTADVREYVETVALECEDQNVLRAYHALNNDFAQFKNNLNSKCSGDYIFQIDADEMPNQHLIINLPFILESNPDIDLFIVPRVNTVEGLTEDHIRKWGWHLNEQGWINWPDYQRRIYKNSPDIQWVGSVHEVIEGHGKYTLFPADEDLSLYHHKTIDRQERQNKLYEGL